MIIFEIFKAGRDRKKYVTFKKKQTCLVSENDFRKKFSFVLQNEVASKKTHSVKENNRNIDYHL